MLVSFFIEINIPNFFYLHMSIKVANFVMESLFYSLKQLGGGTVLDIGVYCVQFASFALGGEKPTKIVAAGHLNADGIDESTSATLLYPNGKTATLVTHGRAKYECEATIVGTTGTIRVRHNDMIMI
jgi:predicted dehydrogenase